MADPTAQALRVARVQVKILQGSLEAARAVGRKAQQEADNYSARQDCADAIRAAGLEVSDA
jgi:hypothetical protein